MVNVNEMEFGGYEREDNLSSLEELFRQYDELVAASPFAHTGEVGISFDSYESLFEEVDAIVADSDYL